MSFQVLVTAELPGTALERLRGECEVEVLPPGARNHDELVRRIPGKSALLCLLNDPVDKDVLAAATSLRVISTYSVGFDHIDLEAAAQTGVLVANVPDVLTDATADLTIALLLAVARHIPQGDRLVREGRFRGFEPDLLLGSPVYGRTLGIVGLGRIGKAVARRAQGFDMNVVAYSRRVNLLEEEWLGISSVPWKELLSKADYISIHVPYGKQTHHMIGAPELEMMSPYAYLINTSRGPVIDERALVAALRRGRPAGAALDVYEQEPVLAPGLRELDNVVLTPHLGSATWEARERMSDLAVENILAVVHGQRPPHLIGSPA